MKTLFIRFLHGEVFHKLLWAGVGCCYWAGGLTRKISRVIRRTEEICIMTRKILFSQLQKPLLDLMPDYRLCINCFRFVPLKESKEDRVHGLEDYRYQIWNNPAFTICHSCERGKIRSRKAKLEKDGEFFSFLPPEQTRFVQTPDDPLTKVLPWDADCRVDAEGRALIRCNDCRNYYPIDKIAKNRRGNFMSLCKTCLRERQKIYAKDRKERIAANGGGRISQSRWKALCEKYDNRCLCCGGKGDYTTLVKDHVTPVVQGGSNTIDNIQPLCKKCNNIKADKYIDFRTEEGKINHDPTNERTN